MLKKQRSLKELSPEQLSNLQAVFDAMDTDGSDDLDYTELKDALQGSGVDISLKELKAMWISADKDGSSGLSFAEFCKAIENPVMPPTQRLAQNPDEGGGCSGLGQDCLSFCE